ncbi:hypothetical protein O163_08260 [Caldanaerobacter subterraneus subsp. yonseiensis KB-1]|uniref:Tyr recombinase domain-containing protein n=1 Tax=Caldanaerobacter subterraneus subsp. yonseiensis KB-1 TaxID=1388761 RepID=U5CSL8_CALSX|nr:hypothetical protein O163_08260 [Caldanaerobacter subterraneus subsp. yonseiensis KB-1]
MDTTKFHEYRDYVIIQLLYDTGMRVGECLNIQMDDIDLTNRAIRLKAENVKNKKERYVFYSQHMSQELKRWIDYKDRYVESDFLFCTKRGNPLRVQYFEKNFRQYGERVGLDVHPHILRHTFAKKCLLAGMDIYTLSKILGHASVTTTEKAYLELTKDDIRKNYLKYSPLTRLKKRW